MSTKPMAPRPPTTALTPVTVYPTKDSALFLTHPTHGKMRKEGALWPMDSFTGRRLNDGSVTLAKPVAPEPEAENPAPTTESGA